MSDMDTTIIKRLDAIFSSAKSHDEAAQGVNAEFIVIHRDELPEVHCAEVDLEGKGMPGTATPAIARADALKLLSLAAYLEAEDAVEAKRKTRRNELAREFGGNTGWTYADLVGTTRLAIDRIIEIEEGAA